MKTLHALFAGLLVVVAPLTALANPYPDPAKVPQDSADEFTLTGEAPPALSAEELRDDGMPVLRVQVDWTEADETYTAGPVYRELSGTPALVRRARHEDPLGSFKGRLRDPATGEAFAFDSLGTGREFRRLTRALTFRFPMPSGKAVFEMGAEDPKTGEIKKVIEFTVDPAAARAVPARSDVTARVLKEAAAGDKLLVNIYADGYAADGADRFWEHARSAAAALADRHFPALDRLELRGVFAPSSTPLGAPSNLGLPVPERDSFLGLYYPYWENFGRWYNVVYPTREERYRNGVAQVPYDYSIVLIDNDEYWGVGNYKEFTAIPAEAGQFSYLLLHEFGHYFGLNEEYEGGGRTELEFAPEIDEPWSQNMTFLRRGDRLELKWKELVSDSTPVPTPNETWDPGNPHYGAYAGGYGDSDRAHSHKPGFACVMERYQTFCPICAKALGEAIRRDLSSAQ